MLRVALALFLIACTALTPASASAAEIILDNAAPGVQVSGPWVSTSLTPGYAGGDYLFRPGGGGGSTVFWPFPATTSAGHYDVFARWTSGPNRATDALYYIASATGTVEVRQNQQTNGGTWQLLGSFEFQPGESQGVTLSDRAQGVVIADAVRWVGPVEVTGTAPATPTPVQPAPTPVQPAPTPTPAPPPAPAPSDGPWTVTLNEADLHAGPAANTDVLANLPQFSYLQILGYSGEWAYVFNPRAKGTAYIPSRQLGPSDAPPAWVTAQPPPAVERVEQSGRTVGAAYLAFYPVEDKFAYTSRLGHNQPIQVHDRVQGADGSTWYRVDGGYLAAGAVRLPRTPQRFYSGRWIDADLQEPAMLVAYNGDQIVLSTLTIKGTIANQTPMGVFSIGRRVEDETMDSSTLLVPIPPDAPGGYRLEHVLYTQYFTADGASIHYNYWSSNFGFSGSHGCLGVDRATSEFLWNWANIGTTVVIHN
jgi:hypothetical protein